MEGTVLVANLATNFSLDLVGVYVEVDFLESFSRLERSTYTPENTVNRL